MEIKHGTIGSVKYGIFVSPVVISIGDFTHLSTKIPGIMGDDAVWDPQNDPKIGPFWTHLGPTVVTLGRAYSPNRS